MRAICALLLCLVATPAWPQEPPASPVSVQLGLKQPDDGPRMPALRAELDQRGMFVGEEFESVKRWRLRGRVDLTTRAPANPDDSFAEAAFGLVRPWLNGAGTERLIFGLYADARTESNQTVSEWLASIQLRTIVSHLHRRGPWLLVPQVEVAWGMTWAVESKVRDLLAAESGANARVEAEAYWTFPLAAFLTGALAPLTISAELRGFRTNGLDPALKPLGYDRGGHAALMTAYRFQNWGLNGVFVRWSRGRLPSQPILANAWQFGLQK